MSGKILSFSITNFAPFINKTTINFTQTKSCVNKKTNIRYIKAGKSKRVLPVVGIYGKNASGKTSIIRAFCNHLLAIHKVKQLDFDPFLLTDEIVNSTESEIEFIHGNATYKHLISYNNDKVLIEEFWKNGQLIFAFNREKHQTIREIFPNTNNLTSHEGFYKQHYKIDGKEVLLSIFTSWFNVEYGFEILPLAIAIFENNPLFFAPMIPNIENASENDLKIINLVMNNIQNHFTEISKTKNGAYTNYSVNDKLYKLPFTKENNGTRKIAQLYAKPFIEALKNGLILCIDEIDSAIHTEALRFLVSAFKNPNVNKKGAMLIFTAHNTKIIDFIDHENIFMCDRNYTDYSAKIYCPALLKNYNSKTFRRDFEDGFYGSHPITSLNLFGEELSSRPQ